MARMESASQQPIAIPFSFLVRFIEACSQIKPRRVGEPSPRTKHADAFDQWIAGLKKPLPPGTGAIILNLLFPHEDKDRRYNMQEPKLSKSLADIFAVETGPGKRGHRLVSWQDGKEGCLGFEVRTLLDQSFAGNDYPPSPTLEEVDALLDELAAISQWSNVKNKLNKKHRRPAKAVLADLFRDLAPFGAAVMTQILLKDIQPVMYTQPSPNASSALLNYNSNAYEELTLVMAMRAWHPSMPKAYVVLNTIAAAAHAVEDLQETGSNNGILPHSFDPILGTPVQIPTSLKGRSFPFVLSRLKDSGRMYAETKYDGERMQIHVDFSLLEHEQITIFSKSKRVSTWDRVATHSIIRAALGRRPGEDAHEKLIERRLAAAPAKLAPQTLILDAEMVPYSEIIQNIDEFWRIRSMIQETAIGPRRMPRRFPRPSVRKDTLTDSEDEGAQDNQESSNSLVSDGTAGDTRHFMVVFFDVMHYNGQNYIERPYEERRALLENLIVSIPGFSQLAHSFMIPISPTNQVRALKALDSQYKKIRPKYEEGIVIKAADSSYNDVRRPWVKLKRDYIPGHGDNVDFVILGSTWSKERGRELGVGPQVETTFYVGCVANMEHVNRSHSVRPHFEIFFVVDYGFSREQLEDFNVRMRCDAVPYEMESIQGLPYTFTLANCLETPKFMFSTPTLVELTGDRFTKVLGLSQYELRSPRITKIWRKEERSWTEGVSLTQLHEIACAAVRRLDDDCESTLPDLKKKHPRESLEEESSEPVPQTKKLKVQSPSPPKRPIRRLQSITNTVGSRSSVLGPTGTARTRPPRSATKASPFLSRGSSGQGNRENAGSHRTPQARRIRGSPQKEHLPSTPALIRSGSGVSSSPPSADTTLDTPPRLVPGTVSPTSDCKPNPFMTKLAASSEPFCEHRSGEAPLKNSDVPTTEAERAFPRDAPTPPHLSSHLHDAAIFFHSSMSCKSLPSTASFPQNNVYFTLDALLLGSGWSVHRRQGVREHFRRAVIFVARECVEAYAVTLECLQQQLGRVGHDDKLRVLLCVAEDIENESLRPVWSSN